MWCYHHHVKWTIDCFCNTSIINAKSERYECWQCGYVLTDLETADRKLFYCFKQNDNLHWQDRWK